MLSNRIKSRRVHLNRIGAAAVEFAVIAPIMFAVTLGMIEMSRLLMVKNAAIQATREGARTASLPFSTNQDVVNRIQEELTLLSIPSAIIETEPAHLGDAAPGTNVLVRVRVNPADVSWLPDFFDFTIPQISAESTMRRESTQ